MSMKNYLVKTFYNAFVVDEVKDIEEALLCAKKIKDDLDDHTDIESIEVEYYDDDWRSYDRYNGFHWKYR